MRIERFEAIPAESWNQVCEKSPEAWLYHRYEWIALESSYWCHANLSFGIVDGHGHLLGLHPLYMRSCGLGTWVESVVDCGIHRHTGLALLPDLGTDDRARAKESSLQHIREIAHQRQANRVFLNAQTLAPRNLSPDREEFPYWITHGYETGLNYGPNGFEPLPGKSTLALDQVVFLAGHDEETLFVNLDEACRRAVRKAIKSGLIQIDGTRDEAIEEYYRLAQLSAKRTGESLPGIGYFRAIHEVFAPQSRAHILFAGDANGQALGAIFLLMDKQAVSFMAGVSDPSALPLRVNDFLHWCAIKWAVASGFKFYRLGPIFPELDPNWPISRVSRFKKKFGGRNMSLIQGTYYLTPERYLPLTGPAEVQQPPQSTDIKGSRRGTAQFVWPGVARTVSLLPLLRPYGALAPRLSTPPSLDRAPDGPSLLVLTDPRAANALGLSWTSEPAYVSYEWVERRPWYLPWCRRPAYRTVLPHITFSGSQIEPIWTNASGRAVVAWWNHSRHRTLLIGLDFESEIIRYRQGNPDQLKSHTIRAGWGFDWERPNYLFDGLVDPTAPTTPWADRLGFFLANKWSELSGEPLLAPLPYAAAGVVLLTGDDDQAYLEKYADQIRVIGNTPITYFMHPQTRHTRESLSQLGHHVELGLHPDALEKPEEYDRACAEQVAWIEKLCGRKIMLVRNHGFLNRGYLGHLSAWEATGLDLDVNYPGVDGTALTGSFLPMRVRRLDGTWSAHYSLLTAFGDGMIYALKQTQREAVRRIRRVAREIESTYPGALVFNFHPQNISDTVHLHEEVVRLSRRSGWRAMGLESYLQWLHAVEGLKLEHHHGETILTSARPVQGMVLRSYTNSGWRTVPIPPCSAGESIRLEPSHG